MNTFLPYTDFTESAKCLDYRRLGKQRVEVLQLIRALRTGTPKHIRNHPACIMWDNSISYLYEYGKVICDEWINHKYKDTVSEKLDIEMKLFESNYITNKLPIWLGNSAFHAAYRSNLLRKNYNFYSKFGWNEPLDLAYIWPSKLNGVK